MSEKLETKDIIQSFIGVIWAALSLYIASAYSKLIAFSMGIVLIIIAFILSIKKQKQAVAGDKQAIKDLNKRIHSVPAILQWVIIMLVYAVAIYLV